MYTVIELFQTLLHMRVIRIADGYLCEKSTLDFFGPHIRSCISRRNKSDDHLNFLMTNYIIERGTYQTDVNDIEIYDGDILEHTDNPGFHKLVVLFRNGTFLLRALDQLDNDETKFQTDLYTFQTKNGDGNKLNTYHIVGNINRVDEHEVTP